MSRIDLTTANDEPCAGCGHPLGNERLGIIGVPGAYHAHCLPHASTAALLATARADGRREGLGEALEKFPVPYMDDAPSGVDREAWHLGYLRARSDFTTAIRAMMGKEG